MSLVVERVVIINTDQPIPMYHSLEDVIADPERAGSLVDVMTCGARRTDRGYFTAYLRRDHAERFALACSRCFSTSEAS